MTARVTDVRINDDQSTKADSQKQAILTAESVCKEFVVKGKPPVQALQDISLHALKGKVTGLVGADGAGKTTLIRIAAGLLVPTSGRVTLLGLDSVTDSLEIQSRIGYMPQKFGLYQDLTVIENMALYADLQGVPGAGRADRYDRLLSMTDLTKYTNTHEMLSQRSMKLKSGQ